MHVSLTHKTNHSLFKIAAFTVTTMTTLFVAAPNVYADPPEKYSKQWNRMAPHAEFMRNMKRAKDKFLCCDYRDGRMGDGGKELEERIVIGPDGREYFQVFLTRNIWGEDSHNPDNISIPINRTYDKLIPEQGIWITIHPDHLLTAEDFIKNCPPTKETCVAPTVNALCLKSSGSTTSLPGAIDDNGPDYCYWPIPHSTENRFPTTNPVTKFADLKTLLSPTFSTTFDRKAPAVPVHFNYNPIKRLELAR